MATPDDSPDRSADPPLLQRLYDRPFVLLVAGLLVVLLFYTAWGIYEILTLPPAQLP